MATKRSGTWPEFAIRDFSEGMVEGIDNNLIPPNAAEACSNFISHYKGIMEKRRGQARFNATELDGAPCGLYSYYNGSLRKLLVTADTKLMVWNPATSVFDDLKTGLTASTRMYFETCANYMVAMNGIDAPLKWTGSGVTSVLAQAPIGKFPTLYKEKLFCVPNSDSSQLWWSDSFAPETWPAVNYWDIKKGDGDEITCLKPFYGDLVIFKNRSTHLLRGTSLDDFRLDEVDGRIGCIGHDAAAVLNNKLYFVSTEGICIFNGLSVASISEERIPRLWKDIDQQYISNANVAVWDNKVWVSLPLQFCFMCTVDSACAKDGEITVSLGGVEKKIEVSAGETVFQVAAKIAVINFDGWEITKVISSIIQVTRNYLGNPLEVSIDAGDTGVTFTITKQAQTTNNLVMVIVPDNGYKLWPMSGIKTSCFTAYNDGTQVMLLSGDAVSGYVNEQDIGTEDFGSPVSAYWIGKSYDGQGIPEHLKKAKKAFIEDYPNQITPVTLKLRFDYGDFHEWAYRKDDGLNREYRVPSEYKTKWRYITPRLSHTAAGKCEVRGLMVPYKPKRRPKGRTLS